MGGLRLLSLSIIFWSNENNSNTYCILRTCITSACIFKMCILIGLRNMVIGEGEREHYGSYYVQLTSFWWLKPPIRTY